MIIGLGMDIAKVDRMERAMIRHGERFRDRIFTPGEQEYCSRKHYPYESYAARFAVKEAVFKALGHGWSECGGYASVEVVFGESGRPEAVLHGKARNFAERLGVARVFITITHDAGVSAAVAILEGE